MIYDEPILTAEDCRIWANWKRICLLHAETAGHRRRVDRARTVIHEMYRDCPSAYVAWSAGKDSTALTHLVAQEIPGVRAMSIKDDCDYPGEREYVEGLAEEWGVRLDVITPEISLQQWLKDSGAQFGEDLHSRGTAFSDAVVYGLIEQYKQDAGIPGLYLGLRKDESHARLMNRTIHGTIYTKADGETVCQPICDWSDVDVFAYLFAHDIEPLHVYKCVGFAESPAKVRKSWWVPSNGADHHCVWLKRYYPSLFNQLRDIMPSVTRFA
jgi:3'-phosphoadenosine 5'-phosphosulfate sulfotransferase (PAPS reductase)/FAD synthetase